MHRCRKLTKQIGRRLENAAAIHHESLGEKIIEEIEQRLEKRRLRHKRGIKCPDCGAELGASSAIGLMGLGGLACPNHDGAWLDSATLQEIRRRLEAAALAPGFPGSAGQSE